MGGKIAGEKENGKNSDARGGVLEVIFCIREVFELLMIIKGK